MGRKEKIFFYCDRCQREWSDSDSNGNLLDAYMSIRFPTESKDSEIDQHMFHVTYDQLCKKCAGRVWDLFNQITLGKNVDGEDLPAVKIEGFDLKADSQADLVEAVSGE